MAQHFKEIHIACDMGIAQHSSFSSWQIGQIQSRDLQGEKLRLMRTVLQHPVLWSEPNLEVKYVTETLKL